MNQMDYKVVTVQMEDYFLMYKLKVIHTMHYFSNKFVDPIFVLSD